MNPTVIDPGTLRNSRNLYMEGDGVCRRRPCLVKVVGPGAAPVVSAIWYDTLTWKPWCFAVLVSFPLTR